MAGARVVIACRDLKKAEGAADDIRRDTSEVKDAGHVVVARLDLSSLASVRQCAQHLLQTEHSINILVNNAGMWPSYSDSRRTTALVLVWSLRLSDMVVQKLSA